MKKIRIYSALLATLLLASGPGCVLTESTYNGQTVTPTAYTTMASTTDIPGIKLMTFKNEQKTEIKTINMSFIGDCVLGDDPSFNEKTFAEKVEEVNKKYSYFLGGVSSILAHDDYTVANLEGPLFDLLQGEELTDYEADKTWTFSGPSEYVKILTEGGIEAVSLANNHLGLDYGNTGYTRTLDVLKKAGIKYFGNDEVLIEEINGIRVGFVSLCNIGSKPKVESMKKIMKYLEDANVSLKVVNMHAGTEYDKMYNETQQILAHTAIDLGADIVVGHHPHILQGIEEYKGKYIAYSLGNFVFGGNNDPRDYDTMILNPTFTFEDSKLVSTDLKIVPCSLSHDSEWNDYCPKILEGEEKEGVIDKINRRSPGFTYIEGPQEGLKKIVEEEKSNIF